METKSSEGVLRYHGDIQQIDMSSGEWLVLARTKYLLEDTKDFCEERGWYYNFKNEKSINEDTLKLLQIGNIGVKVKN